MDVKNELPTPPPSDAGSPEPSGSFSHCSSDSEPDSPMGEDSKVVRLSRFFSLVNVPSIRGSFGFVFRQC